MSEKESDSQKIARLEREIVQLRERAQRYARMTRFVWDEYAGYRKAIQEAARPIMGEALTRYFARNPCYAAPVAVTDDAPQIATFDFPARKIHIPLGHLEAGV